MNEVTAPLRIGNASGFYGDRFSAVREMLTEGPLDVLTGDYLAELTMLILGRARIRAASQPPRAGTSPAPSTQVSGQPRGTPGDRARPAEPAESPVGSGAADRGGTPAGGYAKTFLAQMEEGLGLAAERGVKIVTNAGGLNPAGLADALRTLAERVGVRVRIAHVEGDDLLSRASQAGWGGSLVAANAYLGGWGITACLNAGADVVVTGRVTDAALVSGPAAAHFGWGEGDWDRLAAAVVAGHVLECGAQATGGNYAFFTEHDLRRPGFPLAELAADGSCVITKHPGTGGAVTVETVTAQLLYETQGARYLGPDAVALLDTVSLTQLGPDRVGVSGTRGAPPPRSLKVGLAALGGWRNEVVFVLTGLDIPAKAALVRHQLEAALGTRRPAELIWTLARTDHLDASDQEAASALLRLVVRDPDQRAVGRAVSAAAVELGLASYPGCHLTAPPSDGSPYGVFDSIYVDADTVPHTAVLPDGRRLAISLPSRERRAAAEPDGDRYPDWAGPGRTGDPTNPRPTATAPHPGAGAGSMDDTTAVAGLAPGDQRGIPGQPAASRPVPRAAGDQSHPEATGAGEALPGDRGSAGPNAVPAQPRGNPTDHPAPAPDQPVADRVAGNGGVAGEPPPLPPPLPPGPTRPVPLGAVAGARSGDKGADANVGVWARSDEGWRWLVHTLTVARFRELLPETADFPVVRHVLPNLRAVNFVVEGLLGQGAGARARFDPQAKAVGEWLRSRYLDIPEVLL